MTYYNLIKLKLIPLLLFSSLLFVAVQEERQRNKEKNDNEVESSTTSVSNGQPLVAPTDMPIERILNAEMKVEQKSEEIANEVSVNSFLILA